MKPDPAEPSQTSAFLADERLRACIEHTPNVAVQWYGEDGRVLFWNKASEQVFGWTAAEALGKTLDQLTLSREEAELFLARIQAISRGDGSTSPEEVCVRHRDGHRIWCLSTLFSIPGPDNGPCFVCMDVDVTGRKRVEESLRQSQEQLARVVETTPSGITIVDKDGRITFANPTAEKILGLTRSAITARVYNDPAWKITTLDGQPFPDEELPFRRVMNTEQPVHGVEHAVELPDGQRVMLSINAAPLRDAEGKLAGMVAVLTDVTERKRAQEALRTSEDRFSKAFRSSPMAVTVTRLRDGLIVEINAAAARLFGYQPDEALGHSTLAIGVWAHPGDRARFAAEVAHGAVRDRECWLRKRNGELFLAALSADAILIQGETHILATFLDITERRTAEDALREREAKLQSIFRAAPVGIGLVSNRVILEANDTVGKMTGYAPEELQGQNSRLIYPSDEEYERVGREKYQRIIEKGIGTIETRWQRKDGTILHVLLSSTPLDPTDLSKGVTFTALDITEQKRSDQALRESEALYHSLVENLPQNIFRKDLAGRFTFANQRFCQILGRSLEQILGRTDADFFPQDLASKYRRDDLQVITTGEPLEAVEEHRSPDRPPSYVQVVKTPLRDTQGQIIGVQGIFWDITERKRVEEALQASLEEKTVLLKEVHHRVKNNLQIVSSLLNLQTARTRSPEALETLQETSNRVRSMAILHETLYLSGTLAHISFASYIESICAHLLRVYGPRAAGVGLERKLTDVPLTLDQAVSCGLIISELVSNALKHAFPVGRMGRIQVETQIRDDGHIVMTVADDGVGLPPDLELRQTESLGHRLVHMLAEKLNGTVQVRREAGTTFSITFPARQE